MQAVTLEELKAFLQIDHDAEDALLGDLIEAAILSVEAETGLSLRVTTGAYTEPVKLDDPSPKEPFTVADGQYTTEITDKAPALKTAVFMHVMALYETDPKTVTVALDTARRLCRLHRVDWGF